MRKNKAKLTSLINLIMRKFTWSLFFILLVPKGNAFALDYNDAVSNLTVIEYARQDAEACEKIKMGYASKYKTWLNSLGGVQNMSLRTLETYAENNGLDKDSQTEFVAGAVGKIKNKVAAERVWSKKTCATYDSLLSRYKRDIKE